MSQTLAVMDNGIGVVGASPVHSEHMDETLTITFANCNTGLGIKIVGGKSDEDIHKDYGIFIRRVIPGGLASQEGRLREADQILSVNGESLLRVSNERAVQLLRSAAATNRVTLVVTRNPSVMRRFSELLDSQLVGIQSSRGSSTSGSTSPTGSQSSFASSHHGQYLPAQNAWSVSPRGVPGTTSPVYSDSSSSTHHSQQSLPRLPNMKEIHVPKMAGLGISINGGSNSVNGPAVYISHIVQGGDCNRDGHLKTGDQLVAIDGISLIGLTHEAAKAVLTRTRLRTDKDAVHIAYIPHSPSSLPESSANQSHLVSPGQMQSGDSHPHDSSHAMGPRLGSVSPAMHASNLQNLSPSPHPQAARPSPPTYHKPVDDHRYSPDPRTGGIGNISPTLGMGQPKMESMLLQPPTMSSTPQDGHAAANGVISDDLRRLVLTQGPSAAGPSPVMPNNSTNMMGANLQHYNMHSSRQSTPSPGLRPMSPGRRLSLDPHVRIRVDKLEVALRYLGISPSEEEKHAIRNRLHVDHSGTVPYGDFVSVAKQLFKMQLDESRLSSSSVGKSYDVTDFAEPPPIQPQVYGPMHSNLAPSEVDRLRQERDDALHQVDKLKIMLQEKEKSCNLAEEELLRIRKDAQGAIHESRALKSRVHLAEAAQKEARNMEVDYEEAMRLLEDEITELNQKLKVALLNNKSPEVSRPASPTDMQKRLAVLGCELRKAEISKKTYEVATQKLLKFAEEVHEVITDGPNVGMTSARGRGESSRRRTDGVGFRPPGYLAKHGKPGPIDLAEESKEAVRAVKALIEVEPLPYGWEEAFTKDGMKYYINHVTQCTSWIHPVSNVNHLPEVEQRLSKDSRT